MNIAFYISGSGTRVRKILRGYTEEIKTDLKLLICDNLNNEDLSESWYEFVSMDYKMLDPNDKNLSLSNKILALLKQHNIDYLYCWGAHILKGDLLEVYKNKMINFHPSLLPAFRGCNSIDRAVDSQAILLGNTAHFIDSGVDTGMIIMQNICHYSYFTKGGERNYDAILDNQILMFRQIHRWIKEDRLRVVDGRVVIDDAKDEVVFFPKVEIKD